MWSSPVAPAPMRRSKKEKSSTETTAPGAAAEPSTSRYSYGATTSGTGHRLDETSSLLPSSRHGSNSNSNSIRSSPIGDFAPPSLSSSPSSYLSNHPMYNNSNRISGATFHPSSASPTGNSTVPHLASSSSQDEEEDGGRGDMSAEGRAARRDVDSSDDDDHDCDNEDDDEDDDDDDDHYYNSEIHSIDDPYTYSDDSASLSDAYFLQPLSRNDSSVFGVSIVSDTDSDRDNYNNNNTSLMTMMMTPPSILHLDGRQSPSSPWIHHKGYYLHQQQQRRNNALSPTPPPIIDEDSPTEVTSATTTNANEGTPLLHLDDDGVPVVVPTQQHHHQHHQHHQRRHRLQQQQQQQQSIPVPSPPSGRRAGTVRKHSRRHHPRRTPGGISSSATALRRQQQQQQHQNYHQQRQEWRERLVSQVRGQPQPTTKPKAADKFWSALFLAQLFLVCACAVRSGTNLPTLLQQPHPPAPQIVVTDVTASAEPFLYRSRTSSNNNDGGGGGSANLTSSSSLMPPSPLPRSTPSLTAPDHPNAATAAATFTIDRGSVLSLMVISGVYSCVTAYLSFAFMLIVARSLIPIMLVFTTLLSLCWGLLGLTMDDGGGGGDGDGGINGIGDINGIGGNGGDDDTLLAHGTDHTISGGSSNFGDVVFFLGFGFFALSLAYTMISWNRIPFCSTNLYTAICAMRSSAGILMAGVASLFVVLLWMLVWTVAVMGVWTRRDDGDGAYNYRQPPADGCQPWGGCDTPMVVVSDGRAVELAALLVSFYWTTMVIKNIVRVTVAGAIGVWWVGASSANTNANAATTTGENGDCCGSGGGDAGSSPSTCGCFCCFGDCAASCCGGRASSSSSPCGRCCDSTVWSPLVRACTSSFGTICFGSLVCLPAQTISLVGSGLCWMSGRGAAHPKTHWTAGPAGGGTLPISQQPKQPPEESSADSARGKDATAAGPSVGPVDSVGGGTAEEETAASPAARLRRFMHDVGRTLQSCNRWSYTYIGMYNYSFVDGGEKAIQLFETREWMDIVRDNLIQNILFMASLVIGASSGTVAVVAEEVDGYMLTSMHRPVVTSFWIGFVFGFVLSNVLLLGLVGSAVNTILVCFAAEPFEFDRNHPQLSREMREVWSQQVWEPDAEAGGGRG